VVAVLALLVRPVLMLHRKLALVEMALHLVLQVHLSPMLAAVALVDSIHLGREVIGPEEQAAVVQQRLALITAERQILVVALVLAIPPVQAVQELLLFDMQTHIPI
jgi:hypothetical protein